MAKQQTAFIPRYTRKLQDLMTIDTSVKFTEVMMNLSKFQSYILDWVGKSRTTRIYLCGKIVGICTFTTMNATIKFMNMPDKVLAFRERRVLKELDQFKQVYDEATARVTIEMFPNYRILCPVDQNFNNANSPVLYTSVAWTHDRNLLMDDFTFTATASPLLLAIAIKEDYHADVDFTEKLEGDRVLTNKDQIHRIYKSSRLNADKILSIREQPAPTKDSLERAYGKLIRISTAVNQTVTQQINLTPYRPIASIMSLTVLVR
ncbi:hypothetical protein QAD02_005603 [Eretmocerus hayati]|uniref:Uncharacterized protein n=1 Tax=Eretmocerus hayati TaxID=131215 RepID=A0ACC2NU29_9HYME|nr:hypothetical protein QAD02_005603 [Eretmocerus hayati]